MTERHTDATCRVSITDRLLLLDFRLMSSGVLEPTKPSIRPGWSERRYRARKNQNRLCTAGLSWQRGRLKAEGRSFCSPPVKQTSCPIGSLACISTSDDVKRGARATRSRLTPLARCSRAQCLSQRLPSSSTGALHQLIDTCASLKWDCRTRQCAGQIESTTPVWHKKKQAQGI